jgi:hypothetical protein
MRLRQAVLVPVLLMAAVATAAAQTPRITRIEFSPAPVEQGGGVIIAIIGTGHCTYGMDFGDGQTERRTADLPERLRHVYPADDEYSVTATPEAPCEGVARARIDVRAIRRGIWGISVEPGPATDAPEVVVSIDGRGDCTVNVDFGDTKSQQLEGALPLRVSHTYPASGTYEIHAWAAAPCRGDTTLKVDVRR